MLPRQQQVYQQISFFLHAACLVEEPFNITCRALDSESKEQQRVPVLERLVARLQATALVRHAEAPTPMDASPSHAELVRICKPWREAMT